MVELELRVAVVTFAAVLSSAAVAVLIWMVAISWNDVTGTAVGAIFAVLAGIQVALSVLWVRITARDERKAAAGADEQHPLTSVKEVACGTQA
jgi:hypothetical protein